jgi:RimJ/RimL family protein N-acetyltransferase
MEIGYWTESGHAGMGYATYAAAALTRAAFEYLAHVTRTVIMCDVANRASARVAEKVGYRRVAEELRPIVAPGQTGRTIVWVLERPDSPIALSPRGGARRSQVPRRCHARDALEAATLG